MSTLKSNKIVPVSGSTVDVDVKYASTKSGSVDRKVSEKLNERNSVKDKGAVGDGTTDDNAAFQSLEAGFWLVPYTTTGYVIGDGSTAGSAIALIDNQMFDGEGVTLIHRGVSDASQNRLFLVEDADNVAIRNFDVDAEEQTRVGLSFQGIVRNAIVENLHLRDHNNFALQYGDASTDPLEAYFEDIVLRDIWIEGITGTTGGGSGINFFPRASEADNTPRAKRLTLERVLSDVTEGGAAVADHGPQAIKLSNTDGINLRGVHARGGKIMGCFVGTGAQNVQIESLLVTKANRGLQIDNSENATVPNVDDVRNIVVGSLIYRVDGATGGEEYGLVLDGAPKSVTVKAADLEGDIMFIAQDNADALENAQFDNVTIHGGTIFFNDNGNTVSTPAQGVHFGRVYIDTAGGNNAVVWGDTDWEVSDGRIQSLEVNGSVINCLQVTNGKRNNFGPIVDRGGNTAANATAAVIQDRGDDNVFEGVEIGSGSSTNFFIRKAAGDGFTLKSVKGSPGQTNGIELLNQESSKLPIGSHAVLSKEFDLSGAADEDVLFFCNRDIYILGFSVIYTEATSADAGISLKLVERAGGSDTNRANITSETSQSVDSSTNYINTSGTRSFGGRKISAGSQLVATSAGGKTGTGNARIYVSFVEAMD